MTAASLEKLRELTGGTVPDDKLQALLVEAHGNESLAAQLYFDRVGSEKDDESMGVTEESTSDVDDEDMGQESNEVNLLHELLGGAASDEEMKELLTKCNNDVNAAAEMFFNNASKAEMPPIQLVNGEYEVEITDGKMQWTIGNVLGRIVVQEVIPGGSAHRAHIQKSDVLIECSHHPIKENNCQGVITRLSKENVSVPVQLRFRRSEHGVEATSEQQKRIPTKIVPGTSLFTQGIPAPAPKTTEKPAPAIDYGLQVLDKALESMNDAIPNSDKVQLLQYLLWSDGNIDLAIDRYLQPQSQLPDFAHICGYEWFSNTGTLEPFNKDWPMYDASFPTGPMGITVENIHERTIVVNVKEGTSAARANVSTDSWLVAINGDCVTNLTHKETLHLIQTLPRPLILRQDFCCPPGTWLPALKKQLQRDSRVSQSHSVAGRNERIERHEIFVPEEDRVSFKKFERKMLHIIPCFPDEVCDMLRRDLGRTPMPADESTPCIFDFGVLLTQEWRSNDPEKILIGNATGSRKFLMSGYSKLEDQPDKGEQVVLQTLNFIRQLALMCATNIPEDIALNTVKELPSKDSPIQYAKWLLLELSLNIFEAAAVIEKSTTWDVVVESLKKIASDLPDFVFQQTIPAMIARLSLYSSPSSRIVALALLPIVYKRVQGDMTVQLRGMYDRLLQDEAPLVRRAGAHVLPELALELGPNSSSWTLQMLDKISSDPSDLVRLYAVKAIAGCGDALPQIVAEDQLQLILCQLLPMINTLVVDSDWQVRTQIVTCLPELVAGIGPKFTDVMVDHYLGLTKDVNMEVRVAAAKTGFALCKVLVALASESEGRRSSTFVTPPMDNLQRLSLDSSTLDDECESDSPVIAKAYAKVTQSILPALFALSKDPCVSVRRAMASSVGLGVNLMGRTRGGQLLSTVSQLMMDKDMLVRQNIVEALSSQCACLPDDITSVLVSSIETLAKG
ncbi:hypothetical protein THRCLA_04181, partial [Thraustotheca clavata]